MRQSVVGKWQVGGWFQMLLVCSLCHRVLHESLLMFVLTYGSETMVLKERYSFKAVQMVNQENG